MAGTKSPIKINDYNSQIETSRKELLQEEESKIRGSRGIILKGFLTERQRIEEYLKMNDQQFRKDSQIQNEINNSKLSLKQPEMRYKARTDLERIYDTVNNYSYGRVKKDIIEKQLKNLHLNVPEVQEIEKKEELEYGKQHNLNENLLTNSISQEVISNNKKPNLKRKIVDNSEARKFLKEYHNKTHFKAAADITLSRNISPKNKIHLQNKRDQENNEKNNDTNDEFDLNYIQSNTAESLPIVEQERIKLKRNPNLYQPTESVDLKSIEKLKKLIEKKNIYEPEERDFKEKKVTFTEKYSIFQSKFKKAKIADIDEFIAKNKDENIMIDSQVFLKKDMDLIAKKVLKRCNFFHEKNKNSNKNLKIGEGKLMITGGMSLNQFKKRYNFE